MINHTQTFGEIVIGYIYRNYEDSELEFEMFKSLSTKDAILRLDAYKRKSITSITCTNVIEVPEKDIEELVKIVEEQQKAERYHLYLELKKEFKDFEEGIKETL